MNKTDIRRIIKEEISRAITENKPKFKQGEHFKYMGTDHEVIDDNGFIVTAMTKNGNRVKLNHNQLKAINESYPTTKLPTPGTYNVTFTTERRSSFDEVELDVTENDIEDARRRGSNGYNFWRDIIQPYAPFFTSQDRISTVEKVSEYKKSTKLNEASNPFLDTEEGGYMREYINDVVEDSMGGPEDLDLDYRSDFNIAFDLALTRLQHDHPELDFDTIKANKEAFWQ